MSAAPKNILGIINSQCFKPLNLLSATSVYIGHSTTISPLTHSLFLSFQHHTVPNMRHILQTHSDRLLYMKIWASLGTQMVKNLPEMQEFRSVQFSHSVVSDSL